jgi:predicted nicotinamide N-methyase
VALYVACVQAEAGLGCALWDASIILARRIYAQPDVWAGLKVLEVGSGCGLPGIVAGLYTRESILSDYIAKTVANLQYNIDINGNADDDDGDDSANAVTVRALRANLKATCRALELDWDEEESVKQQDAQIGGQTCDIIFGTELVYTPNEHHHQSLKNVILRYGTWSHL